MQPEQGTEQKLQAVQYLPSFFCAPNVLKAVKSSSFSLIVVRRMVQKCMTHFA